jgi:hypothetical protein
MLLEFLSRSVPLSLQGDAPYLTSTNVVVVDMSIVDEVSKPTYNSGASHCIALL